MNQDNSTPMRESDAIAQPSIAVGTVTAVHDNGLQLHGHERWYNVSKFAVPTPIMPEVGDSVALSLDKAGYIRKITVRAPSPTQTTPATAEPLSLAAPSTLVAMLRLECLRIVLDNAQLLLPGVDDIQVLAALAEQLVLWCEASG